MSRGGRDRPQFNPVHPANPVAVVLSVSSRAAARDLVWWHRSRL